MKRPSWFTYVKPAELMIPLGLLAFVGPGIKYVNVIFNTTTRWGVLAALTAFLLLARRREFGNVVRQPLFWLVVAYGTWGLMTVTWSEVPRLSLAKSMVFFWVTITMLVAGYAWVMRHDQVRTFDFLWLFVLAALFAAPTGRTIGSLELYAGLTGNPNFLGKTLAIASVWVIWRAWLAHRLDSRLVLVYLAMFAASLFFLYRSHSRASILILFLVLLGLLAGLGRLKKWLPPILLAGMAAAAAYVYEPAVKDSVTQYFEKQSEGESGGALRSRESEWAESYERAKLGGVFGVGLGVNRGMDFFGEIGTTVSSGQYGREHGNSQLAIVEQIGLMGLALYTALVLGIIWACVSAVRAARSEADRIAAGLLGGAIVGLLLQSAFEAWWVASGSVESAAFWALTGALLGVWHRSRKLAAAQKRTRTHLQSSRPPFLHTHHGGAL
jgi:hypothetical protein